MFIDLYISIEGNPLTMWMLSLLRIYPMCRREVLQSIRWWEKDVFIGVIMNIAYLKVDYIRCTSNRI